MHLIPTWQDVDVLELVSKALGPLLEFTDAFSGEQLVTVSYLKPVWHCSTLAVKSNDRNLTKKKKKSDTVDTLVII